MRKKIIKKFKNQEREKSVGKSRAGKYLGINSQKRKKKMEIFYGFSLMGKVDLVLKGETLVC